MAIVGGIFSKSEPIVLTILDLFFDFYLYFNLYMRRMEILLSA